MPPVGTPRPVCIRSRTIMFVPARRFWFESDTSVAVSFSESAFLNVVMASPAPRG